MKTDVRIPFMSLLSALILLWVFNPHQAQTCSQMFCGHKNTIVITWGMVVEGIRSGSGHDTIIVEPGARVVDEGAVAVGIDSGNGHDDILNAGTIEATANAVQGEEWYGCGCTSFWEHLFPDASATAIGIDTGNGHDSVLNTGTILVDASSLLTDSGSARSLAIGIDTGNGKDSSENNDTAIVSGTPLEGAAGAALIDVTATSSASLSGNSWELTGKHNVDKSVNTEAVAAGIVGGNGKDSILNASTLNVSAVSDISVEGTSATLIGSGSLNMSIDGEASAIGIDGGNGKDEIINQGDITVSATSDIYTKSIAASLLGAAQVNDSDFDGSTTATAEAVGIYTGNSKDEVFGISNTSAIDVKAEASVDSDSYALTFAGDAITDLSLAASAVASGIGSGSGKDTIANAGTLTVGASSSVESVSLDLNFLDILKSKADLDAEAEAVGISSGSGKDSLLNTGTITVTSEASTEAWTGEFNAIDVAIGDFSSYSNAEATGIASGSGKDTITNTGTVSADASADALVGNFTLTMIDFTAFSELLDIDGDASTTVDATAAGITSGSQDDTIISSGDITAGATTEATTIAVGVGAEGIPLGVPQGDILEFENLASAGVSVTSRATGIDSGSGDDEIINQGNITADASATSWGGSVSLSLPLLEKWVPIPSPAFAMISAGTEVVSAATGIQAGEGDDLIVNQGNLDIDAASSALNVTASLAFQGFVSDINIIDIAAARADAYTKAEATATGIEGGDGDDVIVSSGEISVDAASETLSIAAAIAIQKSVKEAVNLEGTMADVSATASAEATGISGGSGHDTITSTGTTTVTAESNNAGVGLSAAVTCEAEKGLVANAAVAKADTTATAKATGIDGGEGEDTIFSSGEVDVTAAAGALSAQVGLTLQGSNTKVLSLQGALATVTTTVEATAEGLSGGAGNDTIINEGDLTVEAGSLGIAAAIAANITPKKTKGIGIALADAQNTVTATATGISGGGGDDIISNSGDVTVDAGSTAVAASVTVTRTGASGSGTLDPVSFDSGNNAVAIATGIDGGEGNEIITNSGTLDVSSTAVAPSVGVAASSKGISTAITTATSTAEATGIDTGAGTHQIHNTGTISADAQATAVGVSVAVEGKGIAAGIDTFWDGGTSATATAMGIHAESGDDIIVNEAAIDAGSTAVAPSVDVAVTGKGISVGISTATSEAISVGIDAGGGDDQIYNSGAITATALANADAIAVDISGKGAAVSANDVWDGGVEATAIAKGIDAGEGSNILVNQGDITADSSASTVSVGVAIVGKGLSASVSTATATAESVGIDPGDTTENVWNSGDISAEASATAVTANVDITGKGVAVAVDEVWDGGTTATATARGIETGYVDNTVWNEGAIKVGSEATAPSIGVAIAGKGLTAAATTSTAIADSIGIDTREGDDIVSNSGAITADASATGVAVAASITAKGIAAAFDEVWDGGTETTTVAKGIDAGTGDDSILSSGDITATSSATTVAVDAAITAKGISAAASTATTTATAVGLDAGAGSDSIQSEGAIVADASATGVAVAASITAKGIAAAFDEVWDGGTDTTATALGIAAGTGPEDDTILSSGDITASSDATTVAVDAAITAKGISAATSTATTTATAVGIDAGGGSDSIQSEGAITADASATGVAVAAGITAKGISLATDAVWDGGTHTATVARGIDAGTGDDSILSTGDITATTEATTVAVDAAITAMGISAATTTATTTATAVGIDAGEGNDVIESEGAITADASATGVAVAAGITAKGISLATDAVWDGGTETTTMAKGIDAGTGDDSILSTGGITATTEATTVAVDAAITAMGITAASSTATTTATAVGIDSGAGIDSIQSEGAITADASATGVAVAASITAKGIAAAFDEVWDGGTDTDTLAKGIDAGIGDDSIISIGDITASSDATTVAVDAAITAMGISAAATTATTTSTAVGIDSGAGNDSIQSEGAITADASATGVAVAAGITAKGIAAATDAVWDGGTDTIATAMGIDAGIGDDGIISTGNITATSAATTVAVDAAITAMGISAAATTATTTSTAVGIDSGAGIDSIQSEGAITADASATGVAVAASITAMGISGSSDAVWDGGTDTTATATGIDAGDGNDLIENNGAITATTEATTVAVDAAIAAKGIAAAATASATTADATGIDGGAGNDTIITTGNITADASALGVGVAAGITGMGISGATDAAWDSGTTADSLAIGIAGGSGDDTIDNTGAISVTSEAETIAVDAAISGIGITAAMTNTTVSAGATGIAGGDGTDFIHNEGSILGDVSSSAIGVGVSVSGAGISLSGADIWDNGVSGQSLFTGIDGGAGNDTIDNSGTIIGTSEATTPAVSVSLTLVGIGGAATTSTADARAYGIDGGDGDDLITNTGAIFLSSIADANTVNVSAAGVGIAVTADKVWDGGTAATAAATGITGGEGNDTIANSALIVAGSEADTGSVGVSASLAGITGTVATSTATATATGIDGGAGTDSIINSGDIISLASADASAVIVSISGIGISAAADSFWDGGTTATAAATGIAGGEGKDIIENSAAVTATAASDTGSTGVTATLAGASASLVNSTAEAQAVGIDGGADDDSIFNTGAVIASATADADTVAVSVAGIGASFAGDQWSENTLGRATATGIAGGSGDDIINNQGNIDADAASHTDATAVSVTLVGYNDAEAENASEATATGIAGGDGNDTIDNSGAVTITSTSTADAGSVSVTLAGASPAEAGTTAMAVGTGIDGGAGNDTIHNEGNLSITSTATTDASSVSVELVGYGDAEADNLSGALAAGIGGGDGNDTIINKGSITVTSTATAEAGSVSVGVAGAVFGDAGTTADAVTVGLDGGAGSDLIENQGSISATSTASTDSSSTGVVVAGSGDSNAECASLATAIGISGGAGDDTILNYATGSISLASSATAKAGSVEVGIAGATSGEAGTTALAIATAIDGGSGSDVIRNAAQIDVGAATATSADKTTVQIFGSGKSDVNTTAVTIAQGIEGGAGDDSIENTGDISVSSNSAMTLDGYSFTFGGASSGQGELSAFSSSAGISGGSDSDTITNEGLISVSALATMSVTGGSDVAFGSASAGANTSAVTDAVGIDGGDGDDAITNKNTIGVNAISIMTLDSSSFSFGGAASSGEGAMSASTRAAGISGGSGGDLIDNQGQISVNATGLMSVSGGSDVAFGSASTGASTTASIDAVGIDGGDGDDTITNGNTISVNAMNIMGLNSSSFTFGGTAASGEGAMSADTRAVGIAGGEGSDYITSDALISVNPRTVLAAQGGSDVAFGGADVGAAITAGTEAAGIDGGSGNDTIVNRGGIIVGYYSVDPADAMSSIAVSGSTWSFGGTGSVSAAAQVRTAAIGIDGAGGDDTILSEADIEVNSTSYAKTTSTGYAFAGTSASSGILNAVSTAIGIGAGAGNNTIANSAGLTVRAGSYTTSTGSASTTFGSAKSHASTVSHASATGIGSGAGDDTVENTGTISVSALALANGYAEADQFWGSPRSTAEGYSSAEARGIDAGDGQNSIMNAGIVTVTAVAGADSRADTDSTIAYTYSKAYGSAAATAIGIEVGDGNNGVHNLGDIVLGARSNLLVQAYSDEDSRIGEGWHLNNSLEAIGIQMGDGGNRVINDGRILINNEEEYYLASTTAIANATSRGIEYDVDTRIYADTEVAAHGIKTGEGDAEIVNNGEVLVKGRGSSGLLSTSDSWDNAHTDFDADVTVKVSGITAGGSGEVVVDNNGSIDISSRSDNVWRGRADSGGDGYGEVNYYVNSPSVSAAEAYGIAVGDSAATAIHNYAQAEIKVDATAYLYAAANGDEKSIIGWSGASPGAVVIARAAGVSLGDGENLVNNEGSISVNLDADADAKTRAYSGNRSTHTYASVKTEGSASGIVTGNGQNLIHNTGDILVTADGKALANMTDSSFNDIQSDSFANALAYANALASVSAEGIKTGNGMNTIVNSELIYVKTSTYAYSNTYADDYGAAFDDTADSYSYAHSYAYGILAGPNDSSQGSNEIHNLKDIVVESRAGAFAAAYARDAGIFDDGGHAYREAHASAMSYGILTGNGNNWITNRGTIAVTAEAVGDSGRTSAQAYGIKTGSGNDIIENFGTITTLEKVNGTVTKGTGISTGTGNDTVVLHDGSFIGCELNLGEGNDALTVIGSGSISGNVYGGDGTDALTLDGATNFNLDRTFNFESIAKLGSSLVSLNNAQKLESLDVLEGALQINNNYLFTDTGSFSTKVYGGGDCGQLLVKGNLGLAGTMTVARGPGAYLDGATYEVITADTFSGGFDGILLPESTPLLNFDIANTGGNSYLVTASTEKFATVATNRIERTMTGHLDAIVASATGDLSLVLGEIQAMPASGYPTALSSLSPDSYDCSTRTTFTVADQFTQVLSNRLTSLRSSSPDPVENSGMRPLIDRFAFGSPSRQSDSAEQMASYGMWMSGFGQWGGFDPSDGYTGFDFNLYGTTLGYDRYLGRNLTVGASLGYSNTDLYFDDGRGAGGINTVTGSAYGSCSSAHMFIDTALSYSRQSYENTRSVEVGSIERTAESEHGGNTFLAYLGGGLNAGLEPWSVEPLASIQYMVLSEDAFSEEGAGGVNLNVRERATNSLISDLGLRLGLTLHIGRWNLASELYAAWRHDFNVDDMTITASFVDTPDALFTISGPETQANGILLGLGLTLKEIDRFSAALKYNLEVRGQYRTNSLSGEIQYGF